MDEEKKDREVGEVGYDTTEKMRYLAGKYLALSENLEIAFKGKWFTPVSIMEKINYIDHLSETKQDFWEEVYHEYPELMGKSVAFRGDKLFVREQ